MSAELAWKRLQEQRDMKDDPPGYLNHIERVIILNLQHRHDKAWACWGSNLGRGVPKNRIGFWKAIPAADYPVLEEFIDAAAADGFPFFKEFRETPEGIYMSRKADRYPTSVQTQAWSYCQVLRHIADSGKNTIFLYDDRYLVNFYYIQMDIRELMKHEPVRFVQLEYNWHWQVNYKKFEKVAHPKASWIIEGPAGGSENAVFYTPEGAQWMLDYIQNNYAVNIEGTLCEMVGKPREEREGLWTVDEVEWVRHLDMGTDIKAESDWNSEIPYING